jgi:hypothetical protein
MRDKRVLREVFMLWSITRTHSMRILMSGVSGIQKLKDHRDLLDI